MNLDIAIIAQVYGYMGEDVTWSDHGFDRFDD